MSKYLASVVETYRIDSEGEVAEAIAEAKEDNRFMLAKYSSEKKEVKAKGEVIDEYYKVTMTKCFNDLKEPATTVDIDYTVNF